MALDPRFIVAPSLQQLFRDKDTGEPLSNGYVFFYRDSPRDNILKPVYMLTGSPPNYNYAPVPTNPDGSVPLNAIGAFEQVIYYFPFEGTINDSSGAIDLYYIEIFNSDGVPQGTVEGYPNFTTEEVSDVEEVSFVSNGKFTLNLERPNNGLIDADADDTEVAYGGWHFIRSISMGSTEDNVTFVRDSSFSEMPLDNPRYRIQLNATSGGTGAFKDLRLRFSNVNRFASDTQEYTFGFWGASLGADIDVNIVINKNYGTGGVPSNPERTVLSGSTRTIMSGFNAYSLNFTFGSNEGKVIGDNDDDYVEIGISLPVSDAYTLQFTDFFLFLGNKTGDQFPVTTDREDRSSALGGGMPTPARDGSDLYLPLVLGQFGLEYDSSTVGTLEMVPYVTPPANTNRLICDGASYDCEEKSPLGIPYSRLCNKLYDTSSGQTIFGTGYDFISAQAFNSNQVGIINNRAGVVTASADNDTGFTISTVTSGLNPFSISAAPYTDRFGAKVRCVTHNIPPNIPEPTAWNIPDWTITGTGMSLNIIRESQSQDGRVSDKSPINKVIDISIDNVGNINGGDSIQCYGYDDTVAGDVFQFYLWMIVDGAGIDPGGVGTSIAVSILSTDSPQIVSYKIVSAMNQREGSLIETIAAGALSGTYWTFQTALEASTQNWAVWYNEDGSGSAPVLVDTKLVEVPISSVATASEVAEATRNAINQRMVGVPDTRGLVLRGMNGDSFQDNYNSSLRYSYQNPFNTGNQIGTVEHDFAVTHHHWIPFTTGSGVPAGTGGNTAMDHLPAANQNFQTFGLATHTAEQNENNDDVPNYNVQNTMRNMYINYAIIY